MTPTPELITRLRRYLGERIPPNGAEEDTRFLDFELEDLIEESKTLFGAASIGWTEKAAMMQDELGNIEETRTGQETYRFTKLADSIAYALKMADYYAEKNSEELGKGQSGYIFEVEKPKVL